MESLSQERPLARDELVARLRAEGQGEATSEPRSFRSAPAEARRAAVMGVVGVPGTLTVLVTVGLRNSAPAYLAAAAAALLTLVYLLYRSATISIQADAHRVAVRNPYRSWVVTWNEIELVEPATRVVPLGQLPVIRFRMTSGRHRKAWAVPRSDAGQDFVLQELLALAPGHVALRSRAESASH